MKIEKLIEFTPDRAFWERWKTNKPQLLASGIRSDTGTGKTYVSLGVARNLGIPVFIVCPVPAIPSWKRAIKLTGTHCLGIVNYERLRSKKNKFVSREKEHIFLPKCLVIYDEAHKVKNYKTINSEIALLFREKSFPCCFCPQP